MDGKDGFGRCGLPCPRGLHACQEIDQHEGPCPPCTMLVGLDGSVNICPHSEGVFCNEVEDLDLEVAKCQEMVEKMRPCGHVIEVVCSDPLLWIKDSGCEVPVMKMRKCGHEVEVLCCEEVPKDMKCESVVAEQRPCGHPGPVHCYEGIGVPPVYPCDQKCLKKCWRKHDCPGKCGKQCPSCKVNIHSRDVCVAKKHTVMFFCGDVDPATMDINCQEKCEAQLLGCAHKCEKQCHAEEIPHERCQVKVVVRFDPCGHTLEMTCAEEQEHQAKSDRGKLCPFTVPYTRETPCGHNVRIPCYLNGIAELKPEYLLQFCKHPCRTTLACGHPCSGTCRDCKQGRFHRSCKDRCRKMLLCGHECITRCSAACPPCTKRCLRSCPRHGRCKQLCGFPCRPCIRELDECELTCRHHVNCKRKRCEDACTVPLCDRPCDRVIQSCGHPCISLCGEPCPTLCRICNADTLLAGIFDGSTAVEETHMFIQLECGHCIEMESLKQHLAIEPEDREIFRKSCPLCRQPIWNCQRFHLLVQKNDEDMRAATTIIFGDGDRGVALGLFLEWKERKRANPYHEEPTNNPVFQGFGRTPVPERTFAPYDGIYRKLIGKLMKLNPGDPEREQIKELLKVNLPVATIRLVGDIIAWMLEQEAILFEYHRKKLKEAKHLRAVVDEALIWVDKQKLPLKPQGLLDLNRAMHRAADVESVLIRMVTYPSDGRPRVHASTSPAGLAAFKEAFDAALVPEPYTGDMRSRFLAFRLQLDDIVGHHLGVSLEETRQIVAAFGGPAGRWFKCQNGHPFIITECGGATQVGVCNECGVAIGGTHHAVLPGVQLAPEMDGAARPAWPNALDQAAVQAAAQAEGFGFGPHARQ